MSHHGWPPVRIRNYADEVQACLHLGSPLAQLDGLLCTLRKWHSEKHDISPSEASGRFCALLDALCRDIAFMRTTLGWELDHAKDAADKPATPLAFSPLDAVDEYRPQHPVNFEIVEHPETPKDEGLAA